MSFLIMILSFLSDVSFILSDQLTVTFEFSDNFYTIRIAVKFSFRQWSRFISIPSLSTVKRNYSHYFSVYSMCAYFTMVSMVLSTKPNLVYTLHSG